MSPPTDGPPPQTAAALTARLDALADPGHAEQLQRFFKTGPGEYGEGDVFIGLRMPQIRAVVRDFRELAPGEVESVLASEVHEHRMAALLVLVEQSKRSLKRGDLAAARELSDFYLAHTDRVNNWDLVDVTCRDVVGEYLVASGDVEPLKRLARSDSLWERRIAMIGTAAFIRAGRPEVAFELADLLVDDGHDLMHKAVGWMLREAGKKDPTGLDDFLERQAATMPRTALRYAIERMPAERRADWMARRASSAGADR
ncbi:MAG: DNA alkylation repair protein [Actinobacteria bacterium]|nr:DNA alkylation repair protein [Actinomycetota bacterium]